ncbi:MAG: hypothetical protein LBF37_01065 [Rickettsiales bacterium]|nr:hypothetical protein [Rickettsiales bacterium]
MKKIFSVLYASFYSLDCFANIVSTEYIRNKIQSDWDIVLPEIGGLIATGRYLMSAIDAANLALNGVSTNYAVAAVPNVIAKSFVDFNFGKIKYCSAGTYLSALSNDCMDCGLGHYCMGGSSRDDCTYGIIACSGVNHLSDPALPNIAQGKINTLLSLGDIESIGIPATDFSAYEQISCCSQQDASIHQNLATLLAGQRCANGVIGPGTYMFVETYPYSSWMGDVRPVNAINGNIGYGSAHLVVFDHPVAYTSAHGAGVYQSFVDVNHTTFQEISFTAPGGGNTWRWEVNENQTNVSGLAAAPGLGLCVYKLR